MTLKPGDRVRFTAARRREFSPHGAWAGCDVGTVVSVSEMDGWPCVRVDFGPDYPRLPWFVDSLELVAPRCRRREVPNVQAG